MMDHETVDQDSDDDMTIPREMLARIAEERIISLTSVIIDFNTVRRPAQITSAKWFGVVLKPFQSSSSGVKEGLRRLKMSKP